MKKIFALFLLLTTLLCSSDLMGAPLRRPISPSQPMWIIHIDTWNNPDPERINVLMLYFGSSHKNVFIDCVKVFDYPTESTAITELPLSSPISTDTAPTYDLSGRKVTTLKKGLYIRNGKKFFKN